MSLKVESSYCSEIQSRLADTTAEAIQMVVADNKNRTEGCAENITLLSKGCYYPSEYFRLLKESKQTT